MFKKRKNRDSAWSKAAEKGKSAATIDPHKFSAKALFKLMGVGASPAKKAAVIDSSNQLVFSGKIFTPEKKHVSHFLSPSKYQLSTPESGPKTSHIITPGGSKLFPSRFITTDDSTIGIFLPEPKVAGKSLTLPKKPSAWVKDCPVPKAPMNGMIDIPINKAKIEKVKKICGQRKQLGENVRGVSQNQIMQIAANEALIRSGFPVSPKTGQWLHLIAYAFIGDEGQNPQNLGLGTRHANGAMELVNRVLETLFYEENAPENLYLSALPHWVEGFENCRLLGSITLIIKDAPGEAAKRTFAITFNTLTLDDVCETDIEPIKKAIYAKFLIKAQLLPPSPATPAKSPFKSLGITAKESPPPKKMLPKKLSFSPYKGK